LCAALHRDAIESFIPNRALSCEDKDSLWPLAWSELGRAPRIHRAGADRSSSVTVRGVVRVSAIRAALRAVSVRQPTGHRLVRLRQVSTPPLSKSRLSVVAKLKPDANCTI
jgi:hypothetical protein